MHCVLVAILLLLRSIGGQGSDCKLPDDLFGRRSALEKQIESNESDSQASKELSEINERYFKFMSEVAGAGVNANGQVECCKDREQDPIAELICKFSQYLKTGRKQTALLIESVPNNSRSREALWALDEITYLHAQQNLQSVPSLFKTSGPVTLYLDELFRHTQDGNKEALSKFLELYPFADGEYAEEMNDSIEKLLNNGLEIVLSQWGVFEQHPKALVKVHDAIPKDEKLAINSKLRQVKSCTTYRAACAQLKTLLTGGAPPPR